MCRMLTDGCSRKAEHPLCIGIAVRQPALDQPVENTIERNAVDGRGAKCEFDLVVRQRRRRGVQQLHDTNSRWRRACPGTANISGDSVATAKIRRGQGIRPKDFERRLNHSHGSDATLLQLRQQVNRHGQHGRALPAKERQGIPDCGLNRSADIRWPSTGYSNSVQFISARYKALHIN